MSHLDLDALADLLAAEGSPQDLAHVEGCAVCSEALADLDASLVPVAAELATLAALRPPSLPADVAARLEARLRAEGRPADLPAPVAAAGASSLQDPPSDDPRPTNVTPLAGRRSRRRGPAVLGAAAGVLGLLATAGLGLALLRSTTPGESQDTAALSAPEATAEDAAAPTERLFPADDGGTDGGGTQGGVTPQPAAGSAGPVLLRTGTDYAPDAAALARQLPDLLLGRSPAGTPDVSSPLASLLQPAAQASCLSGLSATVQAADARPLLLDQARAFGAPALLVVLPSRVPGAVEVAAVGPACEAGDLDLQWSRRVTLPG